jgi:hypothetical protein
MARNYKKDWETQNFREKKNPDVLEARLERQRARRKLDSEGVDRAGKDVSHRKALSKGGTNKDGYFLDTPSNNRSYPRASDHKPKKAFDKKGPK